MKACTTDNMYVLQLVICCTACISIYGLCIYGQELLPLWFISTSVSCWKSSTGWSVLPNSYQSRSLGLDTVLSMHIDLWAILENGRSGTTMRLINRYPVSPLPRTSWFFFYYYYYSSNLDYNGLILWLNF